jgi:hypothetical protein
MASPRSLPANYPPVLATQIFKSEAQRQAGILRQEVVTDLLSILAESREAPVRNRLVKLVEANLKAGLVAVQKAEDLWPDLDEAKEVIEGDGETKPAVVRKHLKVLEQFNRVHQRSLTLLKESFQHIRVILDRVQPPPEIPRGG